jgi:hypothetical protein
MRFTARMRAPKPVSGAACLFIRLHFRMRAPRQHTRHSLIYPFRATVTLDVTLEMPILPSLVPRGP